MDSLHPRVLYETREATAYPLLIIYNKSISLGYLPADWKLAEVTAIYKKGSKSDAGNYRPVSLTSVCCKVLESILRDHIMGYSQENNQAVMRANEAIELPRLRLYYENTTFSSLIRLMLHWQQNLNILIEPCTKSLIQVGNLKIEMGM